MSEGCKRCERASEQTSEWPAPILTSGFLVVLNHSALFPLSLFSGFIPHQGPHFHLSLTSSPNVALNPFQSPGRRASIQIPQKLVQDSNFFFALSPLLLGEKSHACILHSCLHSTGFLSQDGLGGKADRFAFDGSVD